MFQIILNQIAMFALYMLVGIIAVKARVLSREALGYISRFVMKIALPLLIFTNTINGVNRTQIIASLPMLAVTALMYASLIALGFGVAALVRLHGNRRRLFCAIMIFGNIGFMGIPLVCAIYPENGMLYISLFTILDQLILWTLGMYLTTPAEGSGRLALTQSFRKMINPAVIAVLLSLILILTGWRLPQVFNQPLTKIGATATPLSMIYIGGLFCFANLKACLRRWDYYLVGALKMVAFPVVLFLLLTALHLNTEIVGSITLLAALPTMTTIAMFADSNGSDGEYTIGSVLVTTLISIATLPLLGALMEILS